MVKKFLLGRISTRHIEDKVEAGPCDIVALMDVGLSRTLLDKKTFTIHFIVVLGLT